MLPSAIPLALFRFLLPPTAILLLYLYLYPILHNCGFPKAESAEAACYLGDTPRPYKPPVTAPFRLLALADPQLEGDTSLPPPDAPWFPSLARRNLAGVATDDVPRLLQAARKRLDLWGNDRYLRHVYRSVSWWTDPTHTVALGDLLGSQWISDEEFGRRSRRLWRVTTPLHKVPGDITGRSTRTEILGDDDAWRTRLISVAGNHDIGYAGDIDEHRIARFEAEFGGVNWDIRFRPDNYSLPTTAGLFPTAVPELQVVILNSMNLDTPAYHPALHQQSLDFLATSLLSPTTPPHPKSAALLLTHIPLHKPSGICTDGTYTAHFPPHQGGGIREQNQLSPNTSSAILSALSRHGNAFVLDGHDHEGCEVWHYGGGAEGWESVFAHPVPWEPPVTLEQRQIREVTVRSMMGQFSGNAGLLSAWFDDEAGKWQFEYASCPFLVQHVWWFVHVFATVEVLLGLGGAALWVREVREEIRRQSVEEEGMGKAKLA